MRRQIQLFLVLMSVLLPLPALAATLPMQGILRTGAGGPVADGLYVFIVKLYESQDSPLALWDDTLAKVDVKQGFFDVTLGSTLGKGLADGLLQTGKPLWLGIAIGSDPELPRQALGSTPYAYWAAKSAALDCSGCITSAMLADGAITAAKTNFAYAGSDQKGGSATHALTADSAKVADLATLAKNANTADLATLAKNANAAAFADNAKTADVASALLCSGCVALPLLGADVKAAFVGQKDGVVNFGTNALSGGHFASGDAKKLLCDGGNAGQLILDTTTARLHFCDGKAFQRLTICTDACPNPTTIACGAPLVSSCGESVGCPGTGTFCGNGGACAAGVCKTLGGDALTPGLSCKEILAAVPASKDGAYWIDPDGGNPANAFQAYCDMTTNNGGWTRCIAHQYMAQKPVSWGKTWMNVTWSTTGSLVLDNLPAGKNRGGFCAQLTGAKEIWGEAHYPPNFGADFSTSVLALPAGFFDPKSQILTTGVGNQAIGKDSGVASQGQYQFGCKATYTGNANQGVHALCLSNDTHWQAQHTGWANGQYNSCPDASNQPCTCTQESYCGGSDLKEEQIVMTLYVR